MSIPVIWFGRFITKASFRKCPSLHQCNWGEVNPVGNVSHRPNWIDWGMGVLINLAQNCCKSSQDYIVKQNQIMFHLPQSHHSYPFQPPPLLVQGSKRIACVLGIGMNASINISIRSHKLQVLLTFVFGLRPVANITCENPPIVSLLVFRDNRSSFDLVTARGVCSVWNVMPLKDICSAMKSLTCASGKKGKNKDISKAFDLLSMLYLIF